MSLDDIVQLSAPYIKIIIQMVDIIIVQQKVAHADGGPHSRR